MASWFLLSISPGPAAVFCLAEGKRCGWRNALAGVAGLQAGIVVFFIFVWIGLAPLLASSPRVHSIIKIAGSFYLIYMGMQVIAGTFRSVEKMTSEGGQFHRGSLFIRGLGVQLSNPKSWIFMGAFLPQFIDPQLSVGLQMAAMLLISVGVDALVMLVYAFLGSRGQGQSSGSRVSIWLERAIGAVFILLSLHLLRGA